MRVITGSARGMSLRTLEGDNVRPTTDKVKEAVFSAIQFEVEGRRVLDLFAGSGQLGIEALSRDAENCVFVDADKNAIKIDKENLAKTKLDGKATVMQTDSLAFLSMTDKSDIILALFKLPCDNIAFIVDDGTKFFISSYKVMFLYLATSLIILCSKTSLFKPGLKSK